MTEKYTDLFIEIDAANGILQDGTREIVYPVTAVINEDTDHRKQGKLRLNTERLSDVRRNTKEYGKRLAEMLFAAGSPIRDAYFESIGLGEKTTLLRLRLGLRAQTPGTVGSIDAVTTLHQVVWERLYRNVDGSWIPVAIDEKTPFSRFLPLNRDVDTEMPTKRPLRILFAVAYPRGVEEHLGQIRVEEEVRNLHNTMQNVHNMDYLDIAIMPGQSGLPPELSDILRKEGYTILCGPTSLDHILAQLETGYHIFHFLGHGSLGQFDKASPELFKLHLEDSEGEWQRVLGSEFATQVNALTHTPRLIFFASCESGKIDVLSNNDRQGKELQQEAQAFQGIAQQGGVMVWSLDKVPAVIAMQDKLPSDIASKLTTHFYRSLLTHGSVDIALNQARKFLFSSTQSDWTIPVLYLRIRDGQLFEPLPDDARPTIERKFLFEPETEFIPAGPFLMGSNETGNEYPLHSVCLPRYRIGRTPITCEQYVAFLRDTPRYSKPNHPNWIIRNKPPTGKEHHPVVGVSWHDARNYCDWLKHKTGRHYRLPTEAEWEKAARGEDARLYPWKNGSPNDYCNLDGEGTTPADKYPQGASPYGCLDMLGNVEEWTLNLWGADAQCSDFPYPYCRDDGRENVNVNQNRVHRGGCYWYRPEQVRCSMRGNAPPDNSPEWRGFRVVMQIEKQHD